MDRLRRRADLQRVFREGRRFPTSTVMLHARPRAAEEADEGGLRLAVVAGRKCGDSVTRNRARRIIREACRVLLRDMHGPWDLILVVRTEALEQPFDLRLRTLHELFIRAGLLPGNVTITT